MSSYLAWIVIERKEELLEDIVRKIAKKNPQFDLQATRPAASLRRVGNTAELKMASTAEVFANLEKGQSIRAISSAPIEDIEFFHGRQFEKIPGRYRIDCDALNKSATDSPYRQRFLSIVDEGVTAGGNLTPILEATPVVPNLWLHPQCIEVPEDEIDYLFSPGGPVESLKGSFILPPVRKGGVQGEEDLYFSGELCRLRRDLLALLDKRWQIKRDPFRNPVALTMVGLSDHVRIRDVLMDGGSLKWTNDEGKPTEIQLHVQSDGPAAGAGYRYRTLTRSDHVNGPSGARELAIVVADDIRALLPDGGLEFIAANDRSNWSIHTPARETVDGVYEEGSWAFLNRLHDCVEKGDSSNVFWDRILRPATPRIGDAFPDHNKAELLFMQLVWRCPWPYFKGPWLDCWRRAFRRILMTELSGKSPTAEERVEGWNQERISSPRPVFVSSRSSSGPYFSRNVFVIKYAGEPDDDEIASWRLELPWRSVVKARTIILNNKRRSQLDMGFVLA